MGDVSAGPSRTKIDAAGDALRRQRLGKPVDLRKVAEAYPILDRFRQGWSIDPWPLTAVNMGLRSMVGTLGLDAEVSQRLKRTRRIIDKLAHYPTMRLSQMDDVGGCRVVVDRLDDLHRLRARIRDRWAPHLVDESDYLTHPKADGYRAIHLIVRRHGHLVEVQLRTRRQHIWATTVEQVEAQRGCRIRELAADAATVSALRGASELIDQVDRNVAPAPELVRQVDAWLRSLGVRP